MFQERNGSHITMGLIAGAFVGAGLALLFAPKTGSALRRDLAESVDTLREAVAGRYQDLAARAGVELDHLRERVDRIADDVESRARSAIEAASRGVRGAAPDA